MRTVRREVSEKDVYQGTSALSSQDAVVSTDGWVGEGTGLSHSITIKQGQQPEPSALHFKRQLLRSKSPF